MKYTRNHVKNQASKIAKRTNQTFRINERLIRRCLAADEKALKQVADMGIEGRKILAAMPMIKDNLSAFIQGEAEYNKSIADIYKEGGKAATTIDKARTSAGLENLKYTHSQYEIAEGLKQGVRLENQRFSESMDMIKLKAFIDYHMSQVDHKAALEGQSARPGLAQMGADIQYEEAKTEHLLTYGSDSDLSLIPQKQFTTNPVVKLFRFVRGIVS